MTCSVRIQTIFLASLFLGCFSEASAKAPSVANIIDGHISAHGGAAKWHAVNSLMMSGTLDTGRAGVLPLTLVVKQKRPHFARLEIYQGPHVATQAHNGDSGWKVRKVQGNKDTVVPYSSEDAASARAWRDLGPMLLDHEKKGFSVTLDGTEDLGGVRTYRLKVSRSDRGVQQVWIDASTFLERQVDDTAQRADGRSFRVVTSFRSFQKVDGLTLPSEIAVESGEGDGKRVMHFEHFQINPQIKDTDFAAPKLDSVSKRPNPVLPREAAR